MALRIRLINKPFKLAGGLLGLAIFALAPAANRAGDWPQWLGPTRDGVSAEVIKPWTERLKPSWRFPVGEGHSSPVVVGGRVYLHFKTPSAESETLLCLNAQTGEKIWSTAVDRTPFSNTFGNGPRATPLIHKDRIYTHGASGQLVCHEIQDGKVVWKRDLLKDFGAKNLFFGASASPLIADNRLIVPVGGKGASIVALDPADGSTKWSQLDDTATYSSPVLAKDGMIYFLSQSGLQAVQASDGKPVGKFPLVDRLNESATTPVFTPAGVFASSVTYGGAFLKLEPGSEFLKPIWKKGELSCYFSTPVPDAKGECLYMVTGSILPPPSSILKCVEVASGKVLWTRPKTGKYHAALMRLADGKMLLVDDFGDLRLFEPSKEGFKELAVSRICGQTWAHPALSEGTLYIRDDGHLIAVPLPK